MNIDGLATRAGLKTWEPRDGNPADNHASTVELHGNCQQVVCKCGHLGGADANVIKAFKKRARPVCSVAGCGAELRWRVMLYDDKEADLITDERLALDA